MDRRYDDFSKLLVRHSTKIKRGDVVFINITDNVPEEMIMSLVKHVYGCGGHPTVWFTKTKILREILYQAKKRTIHAFSKPMLKAMKMSQVFIGINGSDNYNELGDVPYEKMSLYTDLFIEPVHFEERVKRTRWVVTRWPTASMAQKANMSTPAFEEYYFKVCSRVDYEQMSKDIEPLVRLMNKTNMVRIIGPDITNLTFSIKSIPAIKCAGEYNIPDGEVFTAPVKDSVNGVIKFNTPTIYDNRLFSGVMLKFRNGQIIDCDCEKGDREYLEKIFDTDPGARFIGEFALGLNPCITEPMGDVLFDEKIDKSFHFTPGGCYDEAPNGNDSKIHWDLVCIQSPEMGGGKIYFDNELIRKDGKFIHPDLENLSPGLVL